MMKNVCIYGVVDKEIGRAEEGDLIEYYRYPDREYKTINYYRYPDREYKTINVDCKRRPTGTQLAHLIQMIEGNAEAIPTIDEVYAGLLIAIKTDQILRENYITQE